VSEPVPTASAIISFSEKLEDDSTRFYTELAKRFEQNKELFTGFARENQKNKVLVKRTYQETITDALEACFSFKGMNLGSCSAQTNLNENATYSEALKAAVQLEEKAIGFYSDAAECGKSLLATIPRAFKKVAETRSKRKEKIESILKSARQ
jgi:rubrerythrin